MPPGGDLSDLGGGQSDRGAIVECPGQRGVDRHRHRECPSACVVEGIHCGDCHRRSPNREKRAAVLRVGDRRVRRARVARTSRCVAHRCSD